MKIPEAELELKSLIARLDRDERSEQLKSCLYGILSAITTDTLGMHSRYSAQFACWLRLKRAQEVRDIAARN